MLNNKFEKFYNFIDYKYSSEESIVLRYHKLMPNLSEKNILETTMKEGARIFYYSNYKSVDLYLLDETSLMQTGTFKSIDGCVISTLSKNNNSTKVCFASGGNTGSALTAYLNKIGIETFFFIPADNIRFLNSKIFRNEKAHLIAVEDPGKIKEAATLFDRIYKIRKVPDVQSRFISGKYRACFIAENILQHSFFDWFSQTISAAFGPIGIYNTLTHLKNKGFITKIPKFLGVQQKENALMYDTWKRNTNIFKPKSIKTTKELLIPIMYDNKPYTYGSYDLLSKLLRKTKGELITINKKEFNIFLNNKFGSKIFDQMKKNKIEITMIDDEIVEKTGLVSLFGILKAIDMGLIKKDEKVLCAFTGGVSQVDGKAIPEFKIKRGQNLEKSFIKYNL